jgi:prepilin-type N-terminal cleavage/methylation domain-containing protein
MAMTGERGFSLIETLIALGLLVIGVLSVTTVFTEGRRVLGDAERRRAAVWVGREKMEEKVEQAYDTLVERAGDAERLEDGMLVGEDRRDGIVRVWTVEPDRPLPGVARVVVTTRWSERGAIRSFRVVGFKARGRAPS